MHGPCTGRVARKGSFAVMEAAGREAPAAPAAEALLSLGSDVRVGMGRDRASRLADSYVGGAGRSAAALAAAVFTTSCMTGAGASTGAAAAGCAPSGATFGCGAPFGGAGMGGAAPPMGGVGALGFAPGHYGALASSSSPSPVVAVAAAGRGGLLPRLPLDPPVGERASIGAVGGGAPGGGAGMCAAAAAGVGFGCGAGGGASTGFVTWSAAQQPPWEHEAALPRPAADIFAQVGGDFQTPEWAAARGPAQWASPPTAPPTAPIDAHRRRRARRVGADRQPSRTFGSQRAARQAHPLHGGR